MKRRGSQLLTVSVEVAKAVQCPHLRRQNMAGSVDFRVLNRERVKAHGYGTEQEAPRDAETLVTGMEAMSDK